MRVKRSETERSGATAFSIQACIFIVEDERQVEVVGSNAPHDTVQMYF